MSDIFFNNAMDTAVLEIIRAGGAEIYENICCEVRQYYIPQCTDEEVRSALDRLMSQHRIKLMSGHYTMPGMDRRTFRRFFCEG